MSVQVFLKTPTGKNFVVDIDPKKDRAKDLLKKAADKSGLSLN